MTNEDEGGGEESQSPVTRYIHWVFSGPFYFVIPKLAWTITTVVAALLFQIDTAIFLLFVGGLFYYVMMTPSGTGENERG